MLTLVTEGEPLSLMLLRKTENNFVSMSLVPDV